MDPAQSSAAAARVAVGPGEVAGVKERESHAYRGGWPAAERCQDAAPGLIQGNPEVSRGFDR